MAFVQSGRWGKRAAVIPGAYGISRQTFNELDRAIDAMKQIPRNFDRGMNVLVHLLAMSHKGVAQRMSRGTVSPTGQAGMPWAIPVRRISRDYYEGWYVKKIGPQMWAMGNDSREAMPIEFGINPFAPDAVPRPILKTSGIETIRFISRTRVGAR